MYHPAELYSGRNTWDSYPAGGPNRGQWAPVNSRPYGHAQRSAAPSYTLPLHTVLSFISNSTVVVVACSFMYCSIVFPCRTK